MLRQEIVFAYNRNEDSIAVICKWVETYKHLVKELAEKIERASLNAKEAGRFERGRLSQ
ncbi:hypothetical protein [Bacteroides graminisolvens]|uniref:hypothetical protein n=1 Tax=Bacteroides graminisolvens TaxID=477666 RepID=UPI0023F17965|nr:hypothetical protein [Bacteroides graminisolvens]MDD3211621.1 hypothetical protein [Bacteroides graminisolvens]